MRALSAYLLLGFHKRFLQIHKWGNRFYEIFVALLTPRQILVQSASTCRPPFFISFKITEIRSEVRRMVSVGIVFFLHNSAGVYRRKIIEKETMWIWISLLHCELERLSPLITIIRFLSLSSLATLECKQSIGAGQVLYLFFFNAPSFRCHRQGRLW